MPTLLTLALGLIVGGGIALALIAAFDNMLLGLPAGVLIGVILTFIILKPPRGGSGGSP